MKSCESYATGGLAEPVEHFFIGDRPEDGGLISSSPEFVPPADVPVDTAAVPLGDTGEPADDKSSAGIPAYGSVCLEELAFYQGGQSTLEAVAAIPQRRWDTSRRTTNV